jgi:predicted AAA+ superfamily ATPase
MEFEKATLVISLLKSDLYLRLSQHPEELESLIDAHKNQKLVVIDEIQRIPELLNEVHRLVEDCDIKFLLIGSSARNLRKKGINLLAGRAWEANLFPLTSHEIPKFDLSHYLLYGGLPTVYLSNEPQEELYAYVGTYLQQEIQAEAMIRKIPAFARFLKSAACMSGKILNFSELANDIGISAMIFPI